MRFFVLAVTTVFLGYVVLLRPLLRRKQYQHFVREAAVNPELRSRYYTKSVSTLWIWVIVVGMLLQLGSVPPAWIGIRLPYDWNTTLLLIGEVVVLLFVSLVIIVRRMATTRRPGLAWLLLDVKELLPRTLQERRLWLLLSLSAGIGEEILFRGFLPWYLFTLNSFFGLSLSWLTIFALSSLLFGFAHIYQGWKGVIGTGVAGAVFAYFYVITGSLLLPMVLHILMDARIVFIAPALLRLNQPEQA